MTDHEFVDMTTEGDYMISTTSGHYVQWAIDYHIWRIMENEQELWRNKDNVWYHDLDKHQIKADT